MRAELCEKKQRRNSGKGTALLENQKDRSVTKQRRQSRERDV